MLGAVAMTSSAHGGGFLHFRFGHKMAFHTAERSQADHWLADGFSAVDPAAAIRVLAGKLHIKPHTLFFIDFYRLRHSGENSTKNNLAQF